MDNEQRKARMTERMRHEVQKIRNNPRWRTVIPYVHPYDIGRVKRELALAGYRYRTEPIKKDQHFVGYKVKIYE